MLLPKLTTALIVIGSLTYNANAVLTSEAYDIIPSGNAGGCDPQQVNILQDKIERVAEMAKATVDMIDKLLKDPPSWRPMAKVEKKHRRRRVEIMSHLFMIEPDRTDQRLEYKDQGARDRLSAIQSIFQKIVDFKDRKGGSPKWKLACSDKFLQVMDSLAPGDPDNPENGPPLPISESRYGGPFGLNTDGDEKRQRWNWWYDNGYRDNNRDLWSYSQPVVLDPPPGINKHDWEHRGDSWSDAEKTQRQLQAGWSRQGMCTDNKRLTGEAWTNQNFRVLMFCNPFFSGNLPEVTKADAPLKLEAARSLDTVLRDREQTWTPANSLDQAYSTYSLFLHELTHQLTPEINNHISDHLGYGYANCDKKDGRSNADSYALLATANWFHKYDWSAGVAIEPTPFVPEQPGTEDNDD